MIWMELFDFENSTQIVLAIVLFIALGVASFIKTAIIRTVKLVILLAIVAVAIWYFVS